MIDQAVILCGGIGSRLGALSKDCPKPLLPVGGEPFLAHLVRDLLRQGITKILLLAAYRSADVETWAARFDPGAAVGATISVSVEPGRCGTGGALWHAAEKLDDRFLLLNGDSWFDQPIGALVDVLEAHEEAVGAISLRQLPDTGRYGVVTHAGAKVTAFQAAVAKAGPGTINAGVYVFRKEIVAYLSPDCSLEQDVLPRVASAGRLVCQSASGYFIDIGVPEDFERAQSEIFDRRARPAIFFDRDGVLNVNHGHVGSRDRFEWIDGARASIAHFNAKGWLVFIVTNQAGIGKAFYTEEDFRDLMSHLCQEARDVGAYVNDYRFCPHHPDATVDRYRAHCNWRKPGAGMIESLATAWHVDREHSLLIGDSESDLASARLAGIHSAHFEGGDLLSFVLALDQG